MAAKHTPGPWDTSNLDGAPGEGRNDHGFHPVGGCGCCGSPWVNGETPEQCQANARLMAAAPELLDALFACQEALLFAYANEPTPGIACRALNLTCDAILKATGSEA